MKYVTDSENLKYRWWQVCSAFFRRYPNPWSKHVLSEDIVCRQIEGPILRTVRVIVKKNKIPRMFDRLFTGCAGDGIYIEESYINRETKCIVSYTRSASFKRLGSFDERCEYTVSPDKISWTQIKREAWATASSFYTTPFESFVVNRYKKYGKKASKGLNHVLLLLQENAPDKVPRSLIRMPPLPQKIWSINKWFWLLVYCVFFMSMEGFVFGLTTPGVIRLYIFFYKQLSCLASAWDFG